MIAGSAIFGLALVTLQTSVVIGTPETPTFDEEWLFKFDEKSVEIEHFTLPNGTIQKVNMMKSLEWYNTGRIENVRADVIQLSFLNFMTKMLVILPDRYVAPNIVEEELKRIKLSEILLHRSFVHLSFPKFKLDAALESQNLPENQDGWNLGVFDYNTERSPDNKISHQKAFLDVNECCVNTSISWEDLRSPVSSFFYTHQFRVNRTFIVIVHKGDDIILQARIADPTNTSYILKTTGTAPTIETTTPANTEIPITPEFATTPGNPTDAPTTIEFNQTTKIFTDNGNEVTTIDSLTSTSEPEISTTVSPSTISIPTEIAPTVEPDKKIDIQSDKSGSLNPHQINEWIVNRIFNMNRTESGSGSSRLLAELNFKQDSNVTQTELGKTKTSSEKTEFTWKFYN